MDELEAIEALARQARLEEPSVGSVRSRVMSHLRPPRTVRVGPLSLFAAASALAASIVLAVGMWLWLTGSDPMAELCAPVQVGLLW